MEYEKDCSLTDEVVPVDFTICMNEQAVISVLEYTRLKCKSREYNVGNGKNMCTFDLVHTSAGMVDIEIGTSEPFARWIADSFTVRAVVVDAKNRHYAEIEKDEKCVRIPFENLLPEKICSTLFSNGIAVCRTNNAHKALSLHLQHLFHNFAVQDASQTLGWKYKNQVLTWNASKTLLQHLSEPSLEAYLSKLNALIQDVAALQFVLCTAATSTVLAYLHNTEKIPVASFGLSLVGTSSTGKTTALQLAASLYSSPDDETVFSGFYGTQNALLYLLGRHHGVPICYDESTIQNDINKSAFIYTFAEGKDKLRLNQDSTLKERNSWFCTCLFSAEEYLVDLTRNENLGLAARILTMEHCTYTKDSMHADQIKVFSSKNFGIVGTLLADNLLKAKSTEVHQMFQLHKNALVERFEKSKCKLTERLVNNYALILTTADILNAIGLQMDTEALCHICEELHKQTAVTATPGKNLVTNIFNYICCEYRHLKGIKWTTDKTGIPLKMDMVETTFSAIVAKCGIPEPKIAVNALLEEGFIIRPEKGRKKTKLSIDGVPCYGYRFDLDKVNAAFGQIDDAVYSNIKKYKNSNPFSDAVLDIVNDEEAVIHAGNYRVADSKKAISGTAILLP